MQAKTSLNLTVKYRPVSLNRQFRMHWSKRRKEAERFAVALESAIEASLSDPSTPTIWLPELNKSLTLLRAAACFRLTTPTISQSNGNRKR